MRDRTSKKKKKAGEVGMLMENQMGFDWITLSGL